MAKVDIKRIVEYTLTLSEEEAQCLMELITPNTTPVQDTKKQLAIRADIYEALERAIRLEGLG